jgi:hypothetical protein
MAFKEVVAVLPTPEEAEDRRRAMRILKCFWRNVAKHFLSVWVTKISRINLFPYFVS